MIKFFVSLLLAFAVVQASAQSGGCSSLKCSSPNGGGGFDCWAGTKEEPCTCADGETAEETGNTQDVLLNGQSVKVYEYHCCDNNDDDETIRKAEECGDFKHFPIGLLIAILFGVMCCCCLMVALFCKGVCVGLQSCCGGGNKKSNSQVMPVAGGGMVMPNANAGTMAQQQMMMQQQMAMQQQQMMMRQPQQAAPVVTVVTNNNR